RFQAFLRRQLLLSSVRTQEQIDAFPSYSVIRRSILGKPGRTEREQIEFLTLERDEALGATATAERISKQAVDELAAVDAELRVLQDQNRILAAEIRALREDKGASQV